MGVRCDLASSGMRHRRHRSDLVGRHFRFARYAAVSQYRAGGNDLEDVGAAVDSRLRLRAKLRGAACHSRTQPRRNVCFRHTRDQQVAPAAGDRQVEARGLDARPGDLAAIHRIAQGAIAPGAIDAHIAHGREAGEQGRRRKATGEFELLGFRATQVHAQVRGVRGTLRDMRVHVDEAGQAGVAREVEDRQSPRHSPTWLYCRDPAFADHHGRVMARRIRNAVDQGSTLDRDRTRVGDRRVLEDLHRRRADRHASRQQRHRAGQQDSPTLRRRHDRDYDVAFVQQV